MKKLMHWLFPARNVPLSEQYLLAEHIYRALHVSLENWDKECWESPGPLKKEYLGRARNLLREVGGDLNKAHRILDYTT